MVVDATEILEHTLHRDGYEYVVGIDEVGRGALAGPVMVGVAVRHVDSAAAPSGLRDSKLLTARRREQLAPLAASWAHVWALGEADADEIETLGIVASLRLAAERALAEVWASGVPAERSALLLDGSHNWLDGLEPAPAHIRVQAKADRDCAIVAAAALIAKVERDRRMSLAHQAAPHYGWDGNKGYGSAAHLAAIAEHGPHPLHRRSWIRGVEATQ